MTDAAESGRKPLPTEIDTTVAHEARVYDYWLGGKDNYAADRALGDAVIAQIPNMGAMARANRAFIGRVVRFLVKEAGIRQFLDIGTGIPTHGNVHQVAQQIAPETRVVYVDNDPIVLAHARALMTGTPEGKTQFIHADGNDPAGILADPVVAETLDLNEPVGLMMVALMMYLTEEPRGILDTLLAAVPSGSYLTISHATGDFDPEGMAASVAMAKQAGISFIPRSQPEVEELFTGLELVEPGVVPVLGWRPDIQSTDGDPTDLHSAYYLAGVARKP